MHACGFALQQGLRQVALQIATEFAAFSPQRQPQPLVPLCPGCVEAMKEGYLRLFGTLILGFLFPLQLATVLL